jgi:hypothetical protein
MRLPHQHKSRVQRLIETVADAVPDGSRRTRLGLPGRSSPGKALKQSLPSSDQARRAGLIAGGLAGLTAGSAGISSVRRRKEGARDGS